MQLRACGDSMLLVELGASVDPVLNDRAIALAERLRARVGDSVRDIVPAYCSVGVHFDPLHTDLAALERAIAELAGIAEMFETTAEHPVIEIPVRYGGEDGPDLEGVAQWAGLSPRDVVERHVARTYRVYMLGFVPGFSYMGRVDAAIAAPRHRVPRESVPQGSVGIAGEQTGVYPISTPGGWRLIGRTGTLMFDASREPAALLAPGDRVRFVVAPESEVR